MIEAIDTQTWTMIAAGVALVAVARGARFYIRKRKSPKDGDPLQVLPMTASETARFSEAWRSYGGDSSRIPDGRSRRPINWSVS